MYIKLLGVPAKMFNLCDCLAITGNLLCSCGGFVRVCRGVRIVLCQYHYLFRQRSFIKWAVNLVVKMVPDPKSIVKQGLAFLLVVHSSQS